MRMSRICLVLAAFLAVPSFLFADFSYQETTQITGGSLLSMIKMAGAFSSQARQANQPVTSGVYLKGNRLARVSPQSTEIIDLDQETITQIDSVKHTYTVMTFEQMKERLVEAQREIREKQAEAPASTPSNANTNDDVKMSFDVKVRQTGAAQQVSGLDTKEAILSMMMNATDTKTAQTGAMAITNDMWLAQEIPGYDQIRAFYARMGEKMGNMFSGGGLNMSNMLQGQPGAYQALANLAKEMQKIHGIPVRQIMRMGTTTNGQPLPAASEAPLPASSSSGPNVGDVATQDAKDDAASQVSRHLGSFGNFGNLAGAFGHKKPAPSQQASASQAPPTSMILLESKTESSNFSSADIDEAQFAVPAGYKQIQTKLVHGN